MTDECCKVGLPCQMAVLIGRLYEKDAELMDLRRSLAEADAVVALYNRAWKNCLGTRDEEEWEGNAIHRHHARIAPSPPLSAEER